jgi:NAD+ synthase (glutamine-hydrolysing)
MQASALAGRIERAYVKSIVLGISGGLDSTLAILAAARAVDRLGLDRSAIHAVTMPCFGTTARTRSNAERLSEELGVRFSTVDIKAAVAQHFADIGHDPEDLSVVYENAQARERTQVLMDIANAEGGMVLGTGDLSELALGFATYNGDHMSMYGINGGIPKTLIRHLVRYEADRYEAEGRAAVAAVLRDVLATPVSPELLPPKDGEIAQCTEGIVGPYELHDFFLYYFVRFGFAPSKILRLAAAAFSGDYDRETVRAWLRLFIRRFFSQQFKRSCLPDGPKVGSVGFSPRGDFKMPSDASAAAWLAELDSDGEQL